MKTILCIHVYMHQTYIWLLWNRWNYYNISSLNQSTGYQCIYVQFGLLINSKYIAWFSYMSIVIQIMLQCVHLCASYKCWEYCDTVNGRLTRYVIFFSSTILGWKAFAHEENSQLPEAEENAYKVNVKFCKFLFSRFFGVRTVSSWQCM